MFMRNEISLIFPMIFFIFQKWSNNLYKFYSSRNLIFDNFSIFGKLKNNFKISFNNCIIWAIFTPLVIIILAIKWRKDRFFFRCDAHNAYASARDLLQEHSGKLFPEKLEVTDVGFSELFKSMSSNKISAHNHKRFLSKPSILQSSCNFVKPPIYKRQVQGVAQLLW